MFETIFCLIKSHIFVFGIIVYIIFGVLSLFIEAKLDKSSKYGLYYDEFTGSTVFYLWPIYAVWGVLYVLLKVIVYIPKAISNLFR